MNLRTILISSIIICFMLQSCGQKPAETWLISAPAGKKYTAINRRGTTVIPNGRLLTPRGRQIEVAPHPYGLALSSDGSVAVTANSGFEPFSVSIIRDVLSQRPSVQQVPPQAQTDKGILAAVFMGLAISSDNKMLFVGGGQEGKVFLFDLTTGDKLKEIDCNTSHKGKRYKDSYVGDLVLSPDEKTLYAVDQANFRVVVIDTKKQSLVTSVPVGRYPFGITLSPDGKRAYVANVGMFEYSRILGTDPKDPGRIGLKYPPFAYLSKEAEEGVEIDGFQVPGLGKPNVPESFSVWEIEMENLEVARVTAKVKTGILVGQMVEGIPAVGGASPNSVVATAEHVYVSNGNNDSISVIDTKKDEIVATIHLKLDPRLGNLRGAIPFGLALSPDRKRLYVAESGINAVAVIDLDRNAVLGHIPVSWFPSKLAVSPDGQKLIVANAKGFGSGPNGGPDYQPGPEGRYVGNLMKGTVSVLDIPKDKALEKETSEVIKNNFKFQKPSSKHIKQRQKNPIPLLPGKNESPLKHLVFIVKENRTFDEVLGGKEGAKAEPSLARYGAGVTFTNKKKTRTVEDATVMPNHLALADRFAISDNFYCDSDVSADGHRFLVGVYPNEWVETNVAASYGDGREMKLDSNAPGVLAFTGASGAPIPDDYTEAGTIWDHLHRNGKNFFNFGLGFDFAPNIERQQFKYSGLRFVINYPMPASLFERTSKFFATYNMSIPDQFRVDMFIKEFKDRWLSEGSTLPSFLTIYLPNDHGTSEHPQDGYPFRESYMADNDLALGRVVEFLSRTPHWKDMAIFVTEDDPQGGLDHVDAHRSLLMVISPYAKRNYVSHVHYSFGSIMKTFWHVLALHYLNQYDAGATDLADMFTDQPDFAPFAALPVDQRIFDPQKALDPLDENFNWKALQESPRLDDPEVMQRWMREQEAKNKKPRD
ncbi:MAG: beta-propeller fold lactonase family protein [Candidatus Aminicenantes bacterium]|nr:beta-propeller fold lactonase family protein [Candidatus Aminicenantes bacterium]